jgi:hypothetical protein
VDGLKSAGKSFEISEWEVWEAYRQVKANKGAPGVDRVTLEDFETDLQGNLFKIWNRMSSGSYFPPPVKARCGSDGASVPGLVLHQWCESSTSIVEAPQQVLNRGNCCIGHGSGFKDV